MKYFSLIQKLLKWLFLFFTSLLVLFVVVVYVKEPPFDPKPFPELGPLPRFESNVFSDVQKYDIMKPEDIAIRSSDGVFFSGLSDGSVVKVEIESGKAETIIRPIDFNPTLEQLEGYDDNFCNGNPFRGKHCGQVLGTKLSEDGQRLIMANKVFGLFEFDLKSETLEKVVDNDRTGSGGIHEMYDDVTYGKGEEFSRKIYYSAVSNRYGHKGMFNVIWESEGNGEVREFDLDSRIERSVVKNFYFPNGVLTVGDYLYVTDTTNPSVTKIDLRKSEVVDFLRLNMYPDNLSYDEKTKKIYVAGTERNGLLEWISNHPFLVRALAVHPIALALTTLKMLHSETGVIVVVNEDSNGKMVEKETIYDGSGEVFKGLTSVYTHDDYIFVGTYFHNEAVRFKIVK